MALCARVALLLLLGALQVLALPVAAANGAAPQGESAGREEARWGGLRLHVRRPRGKSGVCSWLRGRRGTEAGAGFPVLRGHLPIKTLAFLCLGAAGPRGAGNLLSFPGMAPSCFSAFPWSSVD